MKNDGIQIRISDILYVVVKHRFLISALTVAGLMVGLMFSAVSMLRGDMRKEYAINSAFAITTRVAGGRFSTGGTAPNRDDVYLAEDLVDAVIFVMQSDKALNAAISDAKITDVSVSDVRDNLTLTQYEDTMIVESTLFWRNGMEGVTLMNAINIQTALILNDTLNIGAINVINPPSARHMVGGSLNATMCGALAALGLVVGLGVAVLELLMRPTLLNHKDLEKTYGLEILCEVPTCDAYFEKNTSLLTRNDSFPEITDSFSSMAHILNNLLGSKEKHHCLYITSASRGEGKSMAVANLAIQLSDRGKRVLMIDFDLRNPRLGSLFLEKVEYDHSLNALYRSDINEVEAITNLSATLDILPAVLERTTIPLDADLFDLVRKLTEEYDYVIMDTAPVGMAANVLSLNEVVSGMIMVVRHDTASLQEIQDTLDRLDKSGVRLLGCIANDIKTNDLGFMRNRIHLPTPARKHAAEKAIQAVTEGEDLYASGMLDDDNLSRPDSDTQESVTTADDFAAKLFQIYGGKEQPEEEFEEQSDELSKLSFPPAEEMDADTNSFSDDALPESEPASDSRKEKRRWFGMPKSKH